MVLLEQKPKNFLWQSNQGKLCNWVTTFKENYLYLRKKTRTGPKPNNKKVHSHELICACFAFAFSVRQMLVQKICSKPIDLILKALRHLHDVKSMVVCATKVLSALV